MSARELPERPPADEDGYDLWLRYRRLEPDAARLAEYRRALARIVLEASSPTLDAARDELVDGLWADLSARTLAVDQSLSARRLDRARHADDSSPSSRRSG